MCHYYRYRLKRGLLNWIKVEVRGGFLVNLCRYMLLLVSRLGAKTTLSVECFSLSIACLVVFSIGSPYSFPGAVAGELDGKGLSCVGVTGSTEDLYYGFVFKNGRVKALSIVRGRLYIPASDEDVPYKFDGQDRIEWRSRSPLPETRTPSSGFTHVVDRKSMKHTVLGEKGGFEGGLCFFDTAVGVKVGLLQRIDIP